MLRKTLAWLHQRPCKPHLAASNVAAHTQGNMFSSATYEPVLFHFVGKVLLLYPTGSEWLALMRYAVVAVQGSAVAQSNLAWVLEHSTAFDRQQRRQMCLRLLSQAAQGGLPDAWVDAGNIEHRNHSPGIMTAQSLSA